MANPNDSSTLVNDQEQADGSSLPQNPDPEQNMEIDADVPAASAEGGNAASGDGGDALNKDAGETDQQPAEGAGAGAEGASVVPVRKRGRPPKEVSGASSSSGMKERKKGELDAPAGEPICPQCRKSFSSWKAAFGHLRKHPDRGFSGFMPPPTFTSEGSPERIAASLEEGTLLPGGQEGRRGLDIDLNAPQQVEEKEEEAPPSLTQADAASAALDLNAPPPEPEDDEKDK